MLGCARPSLGAQSCQTGYFPKLERLIPGPRSTASIMFDLTKLIKFLFGGLSTELRESLGRSEILRADRFEDGNSSETKFDR